MASSITAGSGGDPSKTSASESELQSQAQSQQQQQQQQQQHQQLAYSATTSTNSNNNNNNTNFHNTHLQQLNSLDYRYGAGLNTQQATNHTLLSNHHQQQQQLTSHHQLHHQQQHQQQHQEQPTYQQQIQQQHHPLYSEQLQPQHSFDSQQPQQQHQPQQHWDYYARQPPPTQLHPQQQQQQHQQSLLLSHTQTTPSATNSTTVADNNATTTHNEQSSKNKNSTTDQQTNSSSSNNSGSTNTATIGVNASSINNNNNNNNTSNNINTNDSVTCQSNQSSNNNYTRPWEMESKENTGGASGSSSNNFPHSSVPKSNFEHFSKLPSFQSQFHGYADQQLMPDSVSTLQAARISGSPLASSSASVVGVSNVGLPPSLSSLQTVAMSPASISVSSPGLVSMGSPLTQLSNQTNITPPMSSGFTTLGAAVPLHNSLHSHSLSTATAAAAAAVHHRSAYPLVPGPLQARDIATAPLSNNIATTAMYGDPLLYQPLTPSYTPALGVMPPTGANTLSKDITMSAFDLNTNTNQLATHVHNAAVPTNAMNPSLSHLGMQHMQPTPPSCDASTSASLMDISNGSTQHATYTGYHTPHSTGGPHTPHTPHTTQPHTPTPTPSTTSAATPKVEKVLDSPVSRVDVRKKERRKNRAQSLESNAESEGSISIDPSSNQVDAVSSTANFKSPLGGVSVGDRNEGAGEKQSKKKRKRCGECIGCQRKDNCGECAPCRNDKSHQICKQRRCEKLTEKKEPKAKQIVYGPDGQPLRTESRRGRSKSRNTTGNATGTATGVRGRKPSAKTTERKLNASNNSPRQVVNSTVSPREVGNTTATAIQEIPQPSPNSTSADGGNLLQTSPQIVQKQISSLSTQQQPLQEHQSHFQQQQQQQQQQQSRHVPKNSQQLQEQKHQSQQLIQQHQHLVSSRNQQQHQQLPEDQQQLQQHHHIVHQTQTLQQQQQHQLQQQQQQQQQQIPSSTLQFQQHQITAQIQAMKEQPQQPMAPMAFYPTWQTDPSQGWQNQFIQQIPQNTPTITTLNSLDFQTQSYGYPSNGYVQTSLGFDPNYGRSPYAAPVQRYDFQSQQLSNTPLNQVGLQSVGFTPTGVTYSGQGSASTTTAPPPNQQQQQHLGSVNDLNKTMSGNDTPGYPRVNSVPPRSLNYNGYPGDYSGTQQQQHQSNNTSNVTSVSMETSSTNVINQGVHQTATTSAQNSIETPPTVSPIQSMPSQSPTRNIIQQQQQQQPQHSVTQHQTRHMSQSPNGNMMAPHVQQQQSYVSGATIPHSPHHNISIQPSQQQQQHSQIHVSASPQPSQHQQQSQTQPMSQDWNWNTPTIASSDPYETTKPGVDRAQHHNTGLKPPTLLNKDDTKDHLSSAAPSNTPNRPGIVPSPMPSNANGIAQQQHTASHFLSYSHHLRNDSTLNANLNVPTGGSFQMTPQKQHIETPVLSQRTQNLINVNGLLPQTGGGPLASSESLGGGGNQIWKPHNANSFKKPISASGFPGTSDNPLQSNSTTPSEPKKSSRKSKSMRSSNSSNSSECKEMAKNTANSSGNHLPHLTNMKMEKNTMFPPPPPSHHYPLQRPDYHNSLIKTEAGLLGPGQHNKLEGYERNYQNFVQYADFCQNEVQAQPSQHQHLSQASAHHHSHQQDYANYHHNTNYYGAHSTSFQQSYQQNFMPGYQHSTAVNGTAYAGPPSLHSHHSSAHGSMKVSGPLPKVQAGSLNHLSSHTSNVDHKPDTNTIIPLPTNYEKDIPAHAYPIPPHRYSLGPHHMPPGLLEPKTEDMQAAAAYAHMHGTTGYPFHGEGGPAAIKSSTGFSCCRQGGTRAPTAEHLKDGSCTGIQTKDEIIDEEEEAQDTSNGGVKPKKKNSKQENNNEVEVKHEKINPLFDTSDRLEKGNKTEVPECDCFNSDKSPPEPGTYYTHLGTASKLADLRKEFEERCQITGRQLRIEKIIYTGKEGKTSTGCPLAKWVIRRADPEEKILVVVKKRPGHRCMAAYVVVCMVAWDGMPRLEADNAYKNLIPKLNKFGLPTTRRCATNENRTCACQGLDPESSGASYSFGCSWSMYYNGCKYARSKTVRKFRLSVKSEESAIEEHMNILATLLAPLFKQVCPRSYANQTRYEKEAQDCRLGLKEGKPFSGVTACLDFCAHAHRDLHNMQDGCTVQVALLKPLNRDTHNVDDEQLHVLPLYTMDTTDEFENIEGQRDKHRTGAVQILEKFPCEVRVRSTPLIPCRRHGKKRKEDESLPIAEVENKNSIVKESAPSSNLTQMQSIATTNTITPVKQETNTSSNNGTQISKSKPKSKTNPTPTTSSSSALPSTPSPRSQTPVTNNPSPAGSAFTTPPVTITNNHPNNSNSSSNNSGSSSGGNNNQLMSSNTSLMNMATMIDTFTDAQLQSNQISSTVLDSPYSYDYQTGSYIDSRNYYNNWPPAPPSHAHNPNAGVHNVSGMVHNGSGNAGVGHTVTSNIPMQTTLSNSQIHHVTDVQHHDSNSYNPNNYGHMPTAGSQQLIQVHDVRGEVKSRGSEDNPDSTTLNNNNLSESKLTTLTPMTPISNLASQHHHHHASFSHANSLEEGFVKPKPPSEYQYTQYPSNYQMYPPPHSAYSAYDAYQSMNYNYGYHHHQAYSPYGMYPQQTPPPTPPPPSSANWNMYGHHQSGPCATPYTPSTPLPPTLPPSTQHHSSVHLNTASHLGQMPLAIENDIKPNIIHGPSMTQCLTNTTVITTQATPFTEISNINNSNGNANVGGDAGNAITTVITAGSESGVNNASTVHSNPPTTLKTITPTANTEANTPYNVPIEISTAANASTTVNSNKVEPIGEVTEISDNLEAFQDPQMGGVAIALNHGSVLIECAKHEMHATTALRCPNRHEPTRMTLIFYQHRNLNRMRHGIDEWEEKMRVKKINTDLDNKAKEEKEKFKKDHINGSGFGESKNNKDDDDNEEVSNISKPSIIKKETNNSTQSNGNNSSTGVSQTKTSGNHHQSVSNKKTKKDSGKKAASQSVAKNEKVALRAPTLTTTSWTTLFPMHPCVVTGPYQEGNNSPTSTTAQQQQVQEQIQQSSQ